MSPIAPLAQTMAEATAQLSLEHEHHTDSIGSKLGMWLFLLTELLLFGGLFLLYSVYRAKNPTEFHHAALQLNVLIGTLNTAILLTSSLTMALSIGALQRGQKKVALGCLLATIALGALFMVNKYFEWTAKMHHGIFPNSPALGEQSSGEQVFYGLYYSMTGLHGFHVLVGMAVLAWMAIVIARKPERVERWALPDELNKLRGGRVTLTNDQGQRLWTGDLIDDSVREVSVSLKLHASPENVTYADYGGLELAGLYWHLVDVIWIFLFPLLYLVS